MVLILNYLPWIIIALSVFAFYKSAKVKDKEKRNRALAASFIGSVVLLVLLQGLTAGYIPKVRSSETKIPIPAYEPVAGEIQNRLRSPELLPEESEKRFNETMDWRQHKRDEALKDNQIETTAPEPVIEIRSATAADEAEKPSIAQ